MKKDRWCSKECVNLSDYRKSMMYSPLNSTKNLNGGNDHAQRFEFYDSQRIRF